MEGSIQQYPIPTPPPKKSAAPLIIAGVAIVALVLVLILVGAMLANSSNNGGDDEDDGDTYIPPEPDIRYVSATYSQETLSGDTIVNVKVTNIGDAIGSKTINVIVTESSGTYSNTRYVTLAPGETATYEIRVNTPFGTEVTGSMIAVRLT